MSRHCALVLHAHVPWVRNPEVPHSLEEDWYHSALVETHLPLLEMLHRLRDEGVPWKLTINLSPPLVAQMQDRLMKRRTLAYIDRSIKLARAEVERSKQAGVSSLAKRYHERLVELRLLFIDRWQGDLLRAYSDLYDSGHLETTASAATHGLLPLLMRAPEAVQAQIMIGVRQFVKCFGRMPRGFWLPECAYAPALSQILREADISWTVVEEHGLTLAPHPHPHFPNTPGVTPEGLYVFGRDQAASSQIWSADNGYPGDPRYRDFMRDVGLDAPLENLREFLGDSNDRRFTGLRYFRSSQRAGESELYSFDLAARAIEEHATHFVNSRGAQLAELEDRGVEQPVSLCAFDADLFGHWWYEGIPFLEKVFRKVAARGDFAFTTPNDHLASGPDLPEVEPVSSSWGEGGYFETWTRDENNWIMPEILDRSAQASHLVKMIQQNRADLTPETIARHKRCLRHMTRELLLSQSSDWGFLMNNESSQAYATNRTREHLDNFDAIRKLTLSPNGDGLLTELETRTPIFEDVPWNILEPQQ